MNPPVSRFQALDLLATPVAVLQGQGRVRFVNAALEDALGMSRRTLFDTPMPDYFLDPQPLISALVGAQSNEFAALRYEAQLRRMHHDDPLPVHVIVAPSDQAEEVIVELLPVEQQTRQEREERLLDQAQANKELIRNLAHEIKNPLGGIRGSAQLLEMELDNKDLTEYTQVIIHEVCERVRALILAEFPKGLQVVRDYDISIPDFRGDREQLIQAVLNISHNAAQALQDRIAQGDAAITLKSRILRQVTFGKKRYRLALELHVVDNGPGVPDSIKDRIFFPLISGREGGSGLGLTLAQTFVQQHHGMIECDSEPGRTDFKILIPLP